MGYELATKLHYIKGNVIFHAFPIQPSFKWLKAGGIFALFKEKRKLEQLSGIWSILSENITPSTDDLLDEKRQTVLIAAYGLDMVNRLKNQLSAAEYARLYRLWHNARIAAEAISAFVEIVILYFKQMEAGQGSEKLKNFIQKKESEVFMPLLTNPVTENSEVKFVNGMDHDVLPTCSNNNLDEIYLKSLLKLSRMLADEFEAERAAREKWHHRAGVIDFVIPGAITDEWRCGRYMHATHAVLENGCPARWIGNQVFPNGFLELRLKGTSKQPQQLWIDGCGNFKVTINGEIRRLNIDGIVKLELPGDEELAIRFEKAGCDYPLLRAVAAVVSFKQD